MNTQTTYPPGVVALGGALLLEAVARSENPFPFTVTVGKFLAEDRYHDLQVYGSVISTRMVLFRGHFWSVAVYRRYYSPQNLLVIYRRDPSVGMADWTKHLLECHLTPK